MNEPVDRPREEVDSVETVSTTVEVDSTPIEPEVETQTHVGVEEFMVSGDDLVAKVKELIHQGNIRRIIVKTEEDRTLIEIPLTVGVVGGVVGAALFPVVAALGAIGALVARLKLVIERRD